MRLRCQSADTSQRATFNLKAALEELVENLGCVHAPRTALGATTGASTRTAVRREVGRTYVRASRMLDESAGKDSEVLGHVVQEWTHGNRLAIQQWEASGALPDS